MDPSNDFPIPSDTSTNQDAAADVIRKKLERLYSEEPSSRQEVSEAKAPGPHSKHQQFILDLTNSGKSLVEIQTEWHRYYQQLPDHEKHEVWQEFYARAQQTKSLPSHSTQPAHMRHHIPLPPQPHPTLSHNSHELRKPHHQSHLKRQRRKAATKDVLLEEQLMLQALPAIQQKPGILHHFRSLLFGAGLGVLVVCIMLFGLFNERFITPFITPSKLVSTTPIISDTTVAVDPAPKIIIPKINVEAPVVFDETSIDDKAVQSALEDGILHYATTANPGEIGNAAFFGHSSNNILNKGKYKFAFLLLKSLIPGDTFYIQKDSKRYVYKVFDKKIVPPTEVSVLDPIAGHAATATLITCDPPGFSTNRLVVIADQISPNPNTNVASTAVSTDKPASLPSNAPSLWSRIVSIF